jgi:hypothetical protein
MKTVENAGPAIWDKIFSGQDSARKTEGRYFYQLALKSFSPGIRFLDEIFQGDSGPRV